MEGHPEYHLNRGTLATFLKVETPSGFVEAVAELFTEQRGCEGLAIVTAPNTETVAVHGELPVESIESITDEFNPTESAISAPRARLYTPQPERRASDGHAAQSIIRLELATDFHVYLWLSQLDWAEIIRINTIGTVLDRLYRISFGLSGIQPIDDHKPSEPYEIDTTVWWFDYDSGERRCVGSFCDGLITSSSTNEERLLSDVPLRCDRIHPRDRPTIHTQWESAPSTGTFESVYRLQDGDNERYRWVHTIAAIASDSDSTEVLGITRDLSAMRNRWSHLERFRELIDHSTDAVYVIERESARIVDVNQQACDMLGYSRDALLELTVMDIDPEFSWERWVDFREIVRETGSARIEVTHRRKDGSAIPVEIEVSYVALDREYHVATVRDISERKQREQALASAESRYESLLEAVPDGILVVDESTLEILEVNEAATALFAQSRDALVGADLLDFFQDGAQEQLQDALAETLATSRVLRRYANGHRPRLVHPDEGPLPVSISSNRSRFNGQVVAYLAVRDVSDQESYEQTLASLNRACQLILQSTSEYEIAEAVAETAIEILELDAVAVYRFEPERQGLVPQCTSSTLESIIGEPPILPLDGSIAGRSFSTGQSEVHDDVRSDDDVFNESTSIRSEVIIPIGDYGVLITGDERSDRFDSQTVSLLEILASTAETAYVRHGREQELRESQHELSRKTASLEQVTELNTQIRRLARTLVTSESKREVETAICEHLAETTSVTFVWIGSVDPIHDVIDPQAWSHGDGGYLESIDLDLGSTEEPQPAVEAIRTGEAVYIDNCARGMDTTEWRREAVLRSFKSMLAVPIIHRNVTHGVLSICADVPEAFDDDFRIVMEEVATTIAYSIASINRKQALISNQSTEIDFAIEDSRCFFLRAAEASNCGIELNGLIPQDDDGTLGFVTITDGAINDFTSYLEESTAVHSHRVLTDDDPMVQLRFVGPFIGTQLAEYGLMLRRATAGKGTCRLTVSVPPTIELNHAVDIVETYFDGATPVSKREQGLVEVGDHPLPDRYLGRLTDRQREAIELAYRKGYFDTPKRTTGAELAEDMDISHSAFHNHLRTAERRLFEEIFAQLQPLPTDSLQDHSDSQR